MNQKLSKLTKKLITLNSEQKHHQALSLINKSKPELKNTVNILRLKAITYMGLKDFANSKVIWLKLLNHNNNLVDAHNNISICYINLGQLDKALDHAKQSVKISPKEINFQLHLAKVYKVLNQPLERIVTLKTAELIAPNNAQIKLELAVQLYDIGDHIQAIAYAKLLNDEYLSLLIQLNSRVSLNHSDEIQVLVPKLVKLFDINRPERALNLVNLLRKAGEFDLSNELLSRLPKNYSEGYTSLVIKGGLITEQNLPTFSAELQREAPDLLANKDILHAIANQYFRFNNNQAGFDYCHRANHLTEITPEYKQQVAGLFDKIKQSFLHDNYPDYAGYKTKLPVFIIGMPRSGTTLLESIISAHSRAFAAGEAPYIQQYLNGKYSNILDHETIGKYYDDMTKWQADDCESIAKMYLKSIRAFSSDANRIVDKLPHNFLHLGMIKTLFPESHIIHIKRNPIACCLSIYKQSFSHFHTYGSDLGYLAEYYKKYQDLMAFYSEHLDSENYMEIEYEDLVEQNEGVVREILEFLELEFEATCIDFHKKQRTVSTASYEQVRKELYTSSLTPWVGIEEYIKPLLDSFPEAY